MTRRNTIAKRMNDAWQNFVNMLKKRRGDAFYNCTEKLLIHFITLVKFTENTLK